MESLRDLAGQVPGDMLESVMGAYDAMFGQALTEGALLENQRQIDAMTRDNIYKTMVANYMGGYPNDWNEPRARQMFNQMHQAFNMPAMAMYDDARQKAASMGIDLPEQVEGQFRNRRGNDLTVMQVTTNGIRAAILNFEGANLKYMPGVARIAVLLPRFGGCGFNTEYQDTVKMKLLKAFMKYVCEVCPDPEAPGAEFDVNLNGLTLNDVMARYGNAVREGIEYERSRVRDYRSPEGTEHGNYEIVRIPDYDTAKTYAQYVNWCICENKMFWDNYSLEGSNTVYFCLRDGFENTPRVAGEDAPLDDYGTSMMCIIVDEDGDMVTSTTRWNDANNGTDWAITPEQVVDLIGRPFAETFVARPEVPDYVRQARERANRGY